MPIDHLSGRSMARFALQHRHEAHESVWCSPPSKPQRPASRRALPCSSSTGQPRAGARARAARTRRGGAGDAHRRRRDRRRGRAARRRPPRPIETPRAKRIAAVPSTSARSILSVFEEFCAQRTVGVRAVERAWPRRYDSFAWVGPSAARASRSSRFSTAVTGSSSSSSRASAGSRPSGSETSTAGRTRSETVGVRRSTARLLRPTAPA